MPSPKARAVRFTQKYLLNPPVRGLFALGLRFQRTRKSHFLGGVAEDAARIADAILGHPRDVRLRSAA